MWIHCIQFIATISSAKFWHCKEFHDKSREMYRNHEKMDFRTLKNVIISKIEIIYLLLWKWNLGL